MTESNFQSILDRPANTIERPKPLPPGTYLCTITGQPRFDKSSKKQTPFVEFTLVPVQAEDDVDEDDLKAVLTDKNTGELRPLNTMTIKHPLYETEKSAYMIPEFLTHCGFEDQVESGQYTIRQLLAETPNCQVYATIKHEANQSGNGVQARVNSTAKVD